MIDPRKAAFIDDLQALLNKHRAGLEVTDDGKPYGMHNGICLVHFAYMEGQPYLEFELPTYMTCEEI
jgi:hypothetical protein